MLDSNTSLSNEDIPKNDGINKRIQCGIHNTNADIA